MCNYVTGYDPHNLNSGKSTRCATCGRKQTAKSIAVVVDLTLDAMVAA